MVELDDRDLTAAHRVFTGMISAMSRSEDEVRTLDAAPPEHSARDAETSRRRPEKA
jgi:hypothetical protein